MKLGPCRVATTMNPDSMHEHSASHDFRSSLFLVWSQVVAMDQCGTVRERVVQQEYVSSSDAVSFRLDHYPHLAIY